MKSFAHTGELITLQLEIWAFACSVVGALLYLIGGSRFCAPVRKKRCGKNGRTESRQVSQCADAAELRDEPLRVASDGASVHAVLVDDQPLVILPSL